jgi:serine protease Do
MRFRLTKNQQSLVRMGVLVTSLCLTLLNSEVVCADGLRSSPIVQAIQKAESAVVNIQGNKTITNTSSSSGQSTKQEVNGMGTGVIIDRRGYIVTNYHVVDEVGRIEVTLADGTTARDRSGTQRRFDAR